MIKILMILGGLGKEGITNSVLTYLENINMTDLDMTLGVAGEAEKKALERAQKIVVKIKFLPGRNRQPIKYFFELRNMVRKEMFDIVHVHGNSATLGIDMLAAKSGGAKVRIAHSRNTSCTHPIMDKLARPVFNRTYTDGFACGKAAGKWLFGNKPFTVMPNGKNVDRFLFQQERRNKIREEYHVKDKIVIGHTGVFNNQKNHKYLIRIFKELCKVQDNYELWLIGADCGTLQDVKEQIKDYGLERKVCFIDYQPNVEDYLCAMDIMVFPSLYEGLPNVVIEWQMSGLPCFLSDTITQECCVMDNVKYLPLDEDVSGWVKAIKQCKIEDRNIGKELIKERMGQAGFDIKQDAEKLRQMYLKLGKEITKK